MPDYDFSVHEKLGRLLALSEKADQDRQYILDNMITKNEFKMVQDNNDRKHEDNCIRLDLIEHDQRTFQDFINRFSGAKLAVAAIISFAFSIASIVVAVWRRP